MKVGLTLPSFGATAEPVLAVAAAADAYGVDGVFVYDHLFRRARDGTRRPALEMFALLGAVAATTRRVVVGSLVARATLRPPAVLASGFATVARMVGPERLAVTIGAGDAESREENESFGLAFGSLDDRLGALAAAVDAVRARGCATWVGGTHPAVRAVAAARADGWNRWGGEPLDFASAAAETRRAADASPFTCSWGGLVVLGDDDDEARAKATRLGAGPGVLVGGPDTVAARLHEYRDAGADWVIVGPIDSSDPDNARRLGRDLLPRLAD